MQTQERLSEASVIEQLLAEPHRFQFVQAVRLLLRWLRINDASGEQAALRFRNSLALTFPASEIEALHTEPAGLDSADGLQQALRHGGIVRVALTPAFLGLLGVQGALPFTITERMAAAQRWGDDDSGRAFLDLLVQRLTTLFFHAVGKFRLEQTFDTEGKDTRLPLLLALAGIPDEALHGERARRGAISQEVMAYYAGLLRTRPVSANAVAQVLSDYFAVPVTLEPFAGSWDYLPDNKRSRLGSRERSAAKLGQGAMLGNRLWRRDLQVNIHIGPVDRDGCDRFLPGGDGVAALAQMLTLFGLPALKFEVRVHLKPSAIRRVVLSGKPGKASRLGWDAYIGGRTNKVQRTETGYMLHAATASCGKTNHPSGSR
jgi:type VI secretion system protein ImpH